VAVDDFSAVIIKPALSQKQDVVNEEEIE